MTIIIPGLRVNEMITAAAAEAVVFLETGAAALDQRIVRSGGRYDSRAVEKPMGSAHQLLRCPRFIHGPARIVPVFNNSTALL